MPGRSEIPACYGGEACSARAGVEIFVERALEIDVGGCLAVIEEKPLDLGIKAVGDHDGRRDLGLWMPRRHRRVPQNLADVEVAGRIRGELEAQKLPLWGIGAAVPSVSWVTGDNPLTYRSSGLEWA